MSEQLFMQERRRSILNELDERGRVSVNDLSDKLKVSAVTIRQDLRALAEEQLLERTHGGAVLPKLRATTPELSFDVRLREHNSIKDALARHAVKYVNNGDSIALDSSTTVFAMLPYLKQFDRLIIVTNSLVVAHNLLDAPHILVMMPGGHLRRDSVSLVGTPDGLPDIHLNAGFISVHGVTAETGFTESSMEEVQMKQAMLAHCIHKYVLMDERKWGRIAPYTLLKPQALTIITSQNTPSTYIDDFTNMGARIDLVNTN